jgi:hypothetical protein
VRGVLSSTPVVTKLFYKAGHLPTSALVEGHIKCSLAIYYSQVALTTRTTLQNKLNLFSDHLSSRCHVAICIYFHFFIFINNAVRLKHLGGSHLTCGPQFWRRWSTRTNTFTPHACSDGTNACLLAFSSKGQWVILYAGSEKGFIPNVLLMFKSGTKSGDDQNEMNFNNCSHLSLFLLHYLRLATGLLFIPQVVWGWRTMVGLYWQDKTKEIVEKPGPVPICPPQIPHGLTQARTWAFAMELRSWLA